MLDEILPISLEDKTTTISWAREKLIPSLAGRRHDTEQNLHLFHQLGTMYSPPLDSRTASVVEGYIALFAGVEPKPLLEYHELGSDRFTQYDEYVRGGYRILGTFSPNPQMAQSAPEAETYFLGAIPVSTKDYHTPDSSLYYPPVFNIHKLMYTVGTNFDTRYEYASKINEVAHAVADFYFWGLVMIHPYMGANHRAFDRFLEYAFYRKGFEVKPPLDHTLNIPPTARFNTEMYRVRRTLLEKAGLSVPGFSSQKFSVYDQSWLTYQHQLNELIIDSLNSGRVQTDEVTESLIAWR